jgi:autotransporter passenger strand-loop-strand repeat protein
VASGTDILSGGGEIVSSGGSALATVISGGTLKVASGGTASGVVFSSGGILLLDASLHLSGTISGFHLGDEIDLRGLAFNSSSSTLTWKQTTSGANASGTLTVKEGTSSTPFTLVGSYMVSNFSATSDGHGGTLITDPPIASGAVVTNSGTGSGSEGIAGAPGSGTTVHSGGYEFVGGGMMQLNSLFSHFAGFVSGFDLGVENGPHSLGFGSSSSAMSLGANAGAQDCREGRQHLQPDLARAVCGGQFQCRRGRPGWVIDHRSACVEFCGSDTVCRAPLIPPIRADRLPARRSLNGESNLAGYQQRGGPTNASLPVHPGALGPGTVVPPLGEAVRAGIGRDWPCRDSIRWRGRQGDLRRRAGVARADHARRRRSWLTPCHFAVFTAATNKR